VTTLEQPSVVTPSEPFSAPWKRDPLDQLTAPRLSVRSLLIQQDSLVSTYAMLYDRMGEEILVNALQWKRSLDLLVAIQQGVQETLRRYDAMHEDHAHPRAPLDIQPGWGHICPANNATHTFLIGNVLVLALLLTP
jgi:hypothetical protein